MFHRSLIAIAFAASALCGTHASANFLFSDSRTQFSVAGKDYDRVTLYAFNDGTGYTLNGTKLLALQLGVTSTKVMRFETGHVNDSFNPPAGGNPNPTFYESDAGLDIVLPASASAIAAESSLYTKLVAPIYDDNAFVLFAAAQSPNVHSKGADPVAAYTNRTTFSLTGAGLGVANGITANVGKGAAYASIVTLAGATVSINGKIGGDTGTAGGLLLDTDDGSGTSFPTPYAQSAGPTVNFTYVATAPEPATLAALASAGLLIARRRRA